MSRSEYVEGRKGDFLSPISKITNISYYDAIPVLYDLALLALIVYASNLLYIITHEMGHAILCSATGGTVLNVFVDYITMSGKTTFVGGNGMLTAAGGLIAGGILSVFLYRSGMWSAQIASAVIAFRTMSECVLIMPGADITLLKGTYIAPLIVGIVLVCGYVTYSGALKGLGRKVDLINAVAVALVAGGVSTAYMFL
ncbi:MAG TPA: M50 family metallopeptidase [Methanocellaceae archaeon]|jgi:hypothetical protein